MLVYVRRWLHHRQPSPRELFRKQNETERASRCHFSRRWKSCDFWHFTREMVPRPLTPERIIVSQRPLTCHGSLSAFVDSHPTQGSFTLPRNDHDDEKIGARGGSGAGARVWPGGGSRKHLAHANWADLELPSPFRVSSALRIRELVCESRRAARSIVPVLIETEPLRLGHEENG